MIISISGTPGSGKTTVADILAKDLGYASYYMGGLRRQLAKEKGMTIDELNKLGEQEAFTDKDIDEYQRKLGKEQDNFIIQGRTSFYFIPHSFKVFLDVDADEGARRVYQQFKAGEWSVRNEDEPQSLAAAKQHLAARCASDTKRYLKYYGFDCYAKKHYDLVIDTTKKTPAAIVAEIKANLPKQ
ncbi:MAG: hypothetical protein A2788_02150 [Candidatus Abawacabacteria bacterium RIFCSPHIGHO2_01_FULL_46_8]|uniref:(d)CMP kinase n=1 Tax=Candidatus Abawacabacteria bacterium RIFCSPHIGHO2_01_FULL_46_8 TaxID=1817815 RepID=A0A1F4XJM8_9BACT|nr:MAG: hypothetical protein A2788_02150 [Candidatus Abawacabacteria bacterium RIFCSPHIGHO2_01_FULL_46_8]